MPGGCLDDRLIIAATSVVFLLARNNLIYFRVSALGQYRVVLSMWIQQSSKFTAGEAGKLCFDRRCQFATLRFTVISYGE